jgi:formylmethanofuran dehydrogenase subunit C
LHQTPPGRISLAGVTPERLAGMSAAEIERQPLRWGKETPALGEFFRVAGTPGPQLVFEGMDARFCDVARGMTAGACEIHGDAGDFVAAELAGGGVTVRGSVGRFAASGMRGGRLHVRGDAGERLGAALPWQAAGMQGGQVVVDGNAGARCGDKLRRGEILVGGDAGDFCAARMVAGTIAVAGRVGRHAGYGMRRGTLLLFGAAAALSPTFVETAFAAEVYLRLLRRHWMAGLDPDSTFSRRAHGAAEWRGRRWLGDLASGGRGEIILLR